MDFDVGMTYLIHMQRLRTNFGYPSHKPQLLAQIEDSSILVFKRKERVWIYVINCVKK